MQWVWTVFMKFCVDDPKCEKYSCMTRQGVIGDYKPKFYFIVEKEKRLFFVEKEVSIWFLKRCNPTGVQMMSFE